MTKVSSAPNQNQDCTHRISELILNHSLSNLISDLQMNEEIMNSNLLERNHQKMGASSFLSEGTESIFVPDSVLRGNQNVFPDNKPMFPIDQPILHSDQPIFPDRQQLSSSSQANHGVFPYNRMVFHNNLAMMKPDSINDFDLEDTGHGDLENKMNQIKKESDSLLPKKEENINNIKTEPELSGSVDGANMFIKSEPEGDYDLESRNEPTSFGFTSVKEEPQDTDSSVKAESKHVGEMHSGLDFGLNATMPANVEPQMPLLKSNSAIGKEGRKILFD